MDYRSSTAIPVEQLPGVAPGAQYLRYGNVRYRLPAKASTALRVARRFLTRVVHDQYDVAGSGAGERSYEANLIVQRLCDIEAAVTEILLLNEPGFSCGLDSDGRIVEMVEYGVGRFYHDESFRMGKVIGGDHGERLDLYRVRPKVQVFFDVCARHPVGQYGAQYFAAHPGSRTPDGRQFLWESYNELIGMIRGEAKARGLDKLDIANTYRSKRAFSKMMAVVKRCFAKRSRIFVICADLFYHAEWAGEVTIDLARDHHATFVNRLRGRAAIRKNLVGAIWKLDWSKTRGHFFRWTFLLDGETVHGTWEYEELVDDLWKSIVPRSAGLTNLLNEARYFKPGTGMIDLKENHEKFDAFVDSVIRYFAYKDQFLCIKRDRGTRTSDSLFFGGKCAGITEGDRADDPQGTSGSTS